MPASSSATNVFDARAPLKQYTMTGRLGRDADGRALRENFRPRFEHRTGRRRLHHSVPFDPHCARDTALAGAEILSIRRGAFGNPLIHIPDIEFDGARVLNGRFHCLQVDQNAHSFVLMGNAFATGVGTVVVLGKPAATQAA